MRQVELEAICEEDSNNLPGEVLAHLQHNHQKCRDGTRRQDGQSWPASYCRPALVLPKTPTGQVKNTYRQVFPLATPKLTAFGYGKVEFIEKNQVFRIGGFFSSFSLKLDPPIKK